MKVLIVCSKNSGKIAPFITEQVEGLNTRGVETAYFTIEQKGWKGYLKSRKSLLKKIDEFQPDLIHAHYGMSGLLANLQRKIPVVTTYHGSDINHAKAFRFSAISIFLSKHNIFVSEKNIRKANVKRDYSLIPCGIDNELFYPQPQLECRAKLKLDNSAKYVLFSGAFNNPIKNPALAQKVTAELNNITLLELKGYGREEVATLMNAVDTCLMTSFTEGSPQFIKEAMACNCPIVSVDVGDVKEVVGNTEGCYVCDSYDVNELAEKLKKALQFGMRTNGRERIIKLGYDGDFVSKKIIGIYRRIIN